MGFATQTQLRDRTSWWQRFQLVSSFHYAVNSVNCLLWRRGFKNGDSYRQCELGKLLLLPLFIIRQFGWKIKAFFPNVSDLFTSCVSMHFTETSGDIFLWMMAWGDHFSIYIYLYFLQNILFSKWKNQKFVFLNTMYICAFTIHSKTTIIEHQLFYLKNGKYWGEMIQSCPKIARSTVAMVTLMKS